uniref:MADF domain-containing protein n=1 Tax=Photinus pyralis TaxID=7054 RepID=A0A1Y1MIF0_PHOPY
MGSESVDKAEWTKSLTITLIGLYEHHLCLYDVKNKFYSNKHARVEALNTIVGRLNEEPGVNFTVDDVKKKIANLRSQFNHELSKINSSKRSGGGTDDLYEPSVWWFEYMAFIKKFIKTRKGKSNLVCVIKHNYW